MNDAPRLLGVALADPGERWAEAGFTVVGGRVHLGPLAVHTGASADDAEPAFVFDRPHPDGATSLDGIAWLVGSTAGDTAPATPHPNGITGTDHVVVMAADLARVRSALLASGFEIRRERPTTMGDTAITQLFAWSGDVLLEVVAPTAAPTAEPTGGPSRLWGLALVAPDIDTTANWFGTHCGPPRAAVQPGRRIATVRHRGLGLSTTIAIMDPYDRHRGGG